MSNALSIDVTQRGGRKIRKKMRKKVRKKAKKMQGKVWEVGGRSEEREEEVRKRVEEVRKM